LLLIPLGEQSKNNITINPVIIKETFADTEKTHVITARIPNNIEYSSTKHDIKAIDKPIEGII
jgi:hypothetical protein